MRRRHRVRGLAWAGLAAIGASLGSPAGSAAQRASGDHAYYSAVADYFGVPAEEVAILGEWNLHAEEVPVVLFVATRAGVPPDVVVAQRQRGSSWRDVADRFRLNAGAFYVPFDKIVEGSLARAYAQYNQTPRRDWDSIQLDDGEIVSLVNLRVLSQDLAVPPARVLEARDRAGDYLSGYRILRQRR